MSDLSWLAPVATVASDSTPRRQHGNPHEQAVLPVLPPVAAENGIGAQRNDHEVHLDELIEAAAQVWGYDADDLRIVNRLAKADPAGLRLALLTDPLVAWHLRARLGPGAPR